MGKKRKQRETEEKRTEPEADERPKRTLLGWKEKPQEDENTVRPSFRNKEKVLVTCSRRINFRCELFHLLPSRPFQLKIPPFCLSVLVFGYLYQLSFSFFQLVQFLWERFDSIDWVLSIYISECVRYRHLMLNVVSLLPHCKKDNKVESKETKGATLNELVELRNCSSCLFFECRKHKDLYLWMAKCPNGPSVKFLVNAVHTMEELKLTGNHLRGSRPILTFSSNFDKDAHWKLLKQMIIQIFGTPKGHQKSKPYHDHVFVFSIVDDHIWFRNYQISVPHTESDKVSRGSSEKMTLVEVGPRFCLNPIKIFGGSFGGPTLYENPFYVSPNQIRALEKKQKVNTFAKKVKAKTRRKMHELSNPLEPDEFADMWRE